MFFDNELLEQAKEAYEKRKWLGIVVSIIMVGLGVGVFFVPASGGIIVMFLMAIGLIIKGISDIIFFAQAPKGTRSGWMLAGGIVWIVLSTILIVGYLTRDITGKFFMWGTIETFLAFMVGFTMIFSGINSFCAMREVRAMGQSVAPLVFSGIIGILAGMVCLSYPIGAIITLTIFYSIFLIVSGVSLFIQSVSIKKNN